MPRLLLFSPCERVIIAQADNSPTLVAVFHSLKLKIDGPSQPPDGTKFTYPMRWAVFAIWFKEDGDDGKWFEQRVELLSPSGALLFAQDSAFVVEKQYHRNTGNIFGFPFVESGLHSLRLLMRKRGDETYREYISFPLNIQVEVSVSPVASPS